MTWKSRIVSFRRSCWVLRYATFLFDDVAASANSTGGQEKLFADDLNVFHKFSRNFSVDSVRAEMDKWREKIHTWGAINRVSFDPVKEHVTILQSTVGHDNSFKLRGCMIDTDLRMHSCMEQWLFKIRPKITAILRTRAEYSISDLFTQFKTHIWELMEKNMGDYFHACASLFDKLDHAQNRFGCELDLSTGEAFLEFNFAPPKARRSIAILDLLHKRVIGKYHSAFEQSLSGIHSVFQKTGNLGTTSNCTIIVSRSLRIKVCMAGQFFWWSIYTTIFRSMCSMSLLCLLFRTI